jgi:hypothetical protein
MPGPDKDSIAREAARLIQTGQVQEVDDALHRAAEILGHTGGPLPGHGRVRKHAQAMSMQAMGDAAYEEQRTQVLEIAEHVMTALEHAIPDSSTLLVGRAAEAHIDAGVTVHIRIYTPHNITEIAAALVAFEYDEPVFSTIDTAHGRMNQLRFIEQGQEVAVTRCPPELAAEADRDLFTERPITALSLDRLRQKLTERRNAH